MSEFDGSLAFQLRQEFKNVDREELRESSWASYGVNRLVGHGKVTNEFCGRWISQKGCLNVEKHDKVIFDRKGGLVNCSGKVFFKHVHHFCNKPSCPVCYKSGWAVREGFNIEARLREASRLYGQVEHVIVSVPSSDYGLDLKSLRKKVIAVLGEREVIGGSYIWHGFRYRKGRGWYFSPHFHVLGFILGGYARCRRCVNRVCRGYGNFGKCDGFEARVRRLREKDGYVVKVKAERKTIYGTAWYQLNHSSYRVDVKRFHIVSWFGVCSYRKLKVTVEKRKELCPVCLDELYRIEYCGSRHVVKDRGSPDYEWCGLADYEENGVPVWFRVKRRSGEHEDLVGHD